MHPQLGHRRCHDSDLIVGVAKIRNRTKCVHRSFWPPRARGILSCHLVPFHSILVGNYLRIHLFGVGDWALVCSCQAVWLQADSWCSNNEDYDSIVLASRVRLRGICHSTSQWRRRNQYHGTSLQMERSDRQNYFLVFGYYNVRCTYICPSLRDPHRLPSYISHVEATTQSHEFLDVQYQHQQQCPR